MKKFTTIVVCLAFTLIGQAKKITHPNQLKGDLNLITEIDFENKGLFEFPTKILQCKNLQQLKLSNNGFVNVPIELSNLTSLRHLDLSNNANISPFDLTQLFDSAQFSLEHLDISENALIELPKGIAKQKELTHLDIQGNYIRTIPHTFMQLSQLQIVNLSNNLLENISWVVNYWWDLKELNVLHNTKLEAEGLLVNLCYHDQIDKLSISNLSVLPRDFKHLPVSEIHITHSTIAQFPRADYSSQIKHITFTDCDFPLPENVVKTLNNLVKPEYVAFNKMEVVQLIPFLNLNVDSISAVNNQLTQVAPLAKMKQLKWLDVRQNLLSVEEINQLQQQRPDIAILYHEPVQAAVGVSPPFPGLEPKPLKKTISAAKANNVQLGQSIFNFPMNAFVDKRGNPYNGPVELAYTEYFTPADILLSGISMTTPSEDGTETVMLSSGGMFNIEATTPSGQALQVNPEAEVTAQLPTSNTDPNMRTWQMNSNGEWEDNGLNDLVALFRVDNKNMDSLMKAQAYSIDAAVVEYVHDRFIPFVKKGERLKDFEIGFHQLETAYGKKDLEFNGVNAVVRNRAYHSEYVAANRLIYDGDSGAYTLEVLDYINEVSWGAYKDLRKKKTDVYSKAGPHYISELRLIPDYENDNLDLVFYFKDSLVNIPVVFKTNAEQNNYKTKEIAAKFNRYQYGLKKYIKTKRRNHNRLLPFLNKKKGEFLQRARKMEKERKKRLAAQQKAMEGLPAGTSMTRSVPIRSFGLWNCDARSRMLAPQQLNHQFTSVAGEMLDDEIEEIIVMDQTQNGVMKFKNKKDAFFDKGSVNVILVFFASGVAVYRSWMNRIGSNRMELQPLSTEDATAETLKNYLEKN